MMMIGQQKECLLINRDKRRPICLIHCCRNSMEPDMANHKQQKKDFLLTLTCTNYYRRDV